MDHFQTIAIQSQARDHGEVRYLEVEYENCKDVGLEQGHTIYDIIHATTCWASPYRMCCTLRPEQLSDVVRKLWLDASDMLQGNRQTDHGFKRF
jgi:hypothetical protein